MKRYIKKHRDVATCDACGDLLLAYGNDRDFFVPFYNRMPSLFNNSRALVELTGPG